MMRRFLDPVAILSALMALISFDALAAAGGGAEIYLEGRRPNGTPVRATMLGSDVYGERAACANCHRPSGYGLSEGELDVPRVTGPILFEPLDNRRVDLLPSLYETPLSKTALAEARMPRHRPAYDRKSLALAITDGVDPAGRRLHPGMPRYQLDDNDIDALVEFLERLGTEKAPGVDEHEIHFATVIAGEVTDERRAAIEQVIAAFAKQHNFDQQALDANFGHHPYRKDLYHGARRQWRVQVWQLEGPPQTWQSELSKRYAERPVFALLGGTATGSWAPIHHFCEEERIPCILPDTSLPEMTSSWTVYFSRGLAAEVEALVDWLSKQRAGLGEGSMLQIVGQGDEPAAFAKMFSKSARDRLGLDVDTSKANLAPKTCPDLVFLWASKHDVGAVDRMMQRCAGVTIAMASGGLLGTDEARRSRDAWPALGMTFPFAFHQQDNPDAFRHRAWLRSRKIESRVPSTEAKTFFALDAARHALRHIVDQFSRPYFLESIEHVMESLPNPGLYDRLSLGAGQRFAAKGIYLFPPDRPDVQPSWTVWSTP